jgi:hypothetical protein
MKAPASRAMNSKRIVSFGLSILYATFAGIRAAWKSIECGMGERFTTLIRTRSPSRTRNVGPGTVPPKVHPSYFTPLAISTVSCVIGMMNSLILASDAGASRAWYAGDVGVFVTE